MLKSGILLLYGAFTHMVVAIFWTKHLMLKELEVTKSMSGNVLRNIDPNFWTVFWIEIIVSTLLIGLGIWESYIKPSRNR